MELKKRKKLKMIHTQKQFRRIEIILSIHSAEDLQRHEVIHYHSERLLFGGFGDLTIRRTKGVSGMNERLFGASH